MQRSPNFYYILLKSYKEKLELYTFEKNGKKVLKGITQKYLETLYASMPNHLQAIIDNPRSHTKY